MTGLRQFFRFLLEQNRIQHNTIAYQIDFAALEDTGRDTTQDVFLPFKFKGMPGVRTSLEAGNNIILRSQYIHHFAFPLIPPLES